MTGVTVHIVDETLDGGPIVAQEAVPVLAGRRRGVALWPASTPSSTSCCRASLLETLARVTGDRGRRRPRRALISVSDKSGLAAFAHALAGLGFELVSTGGTARALREAGLEVTDVADVTGFPEMLDGRVKTLHPRICRGRAGRSAAGRPPRAARGRRRSSRSSWWWSTSTRSPRRPRARAATDDELIEEIDIGGPTLVRAAAKNHASVGIVTDPAQYDAVLLELGHGGGLTEDMRRELAAAAFRLTAGYDALIAEQLARRWWQLGRRACPAGSPLELTRLEELRYGENPHQSAALYHAAGVDLAPGAFSSGAVLLQGKPLSYNNILDAAAATGLARDLRGAACVIVKHANPCGAAEADDMVGAWEAALAGDPVSAFGGVVAVTRADRRASSPSG